MESEPGTTNTKKRLQYDHHQTDVNVAVMVIACDTGL